MAKYFCSVDADVVCLLGLAVWRICFRFVNTCEAYLRVFIYYYIPVWLTKVAEPYFNYLCLCGDY